MVCESNSNTSKNKELVYYYYGAQCYGYRYMANSAQQTAKLLNYKYKEIDITKSGEPLKTPLYFPGNIVVDDLVITYPGSVAEMVQAIENKGVIPGKLLYTPQKSEQAHSFKPLLACLNACSGICLSKQADDVTDKHSWLKQQAKHTKGKAGLVAFYNDQAVAAVEIVREDQIPYSIPHKRSNFLFITCLYNNNSAKKDFRDSLLAELKVLAKEDGYAGISIICGKDTPYPNGPVQKLIDNDFTVVGYLNRVLLKNKWEKIYFMQWLKK